MPNGRFRLHGKASSGSQKGIENALWHGGPLALSISRRRTAFFFHQARNLIVGTQVDNMGVSNVKIVWLAEYGCARLNINL
jgi:hypothetical protein